MQNLVIVESPTKAKTLQRYLGGSYKIEASMGHIRDLPKSDFGVDIEANFEPQYVIPRDKRKRVNELKKEAKDAKILWLATDPDREGEAIAWHLKELLVSSSSLAGKNKKKENNEQRTINKEPDIRRVVFHEITEEAIKEAFENPRDLNLKLVDAQQARRVLDRLVGYKLSPLLWAKVKRGLSAGRVQSVALRLIVEREKEIEAFKKEEYWTVEADLKTRDGEQFQAQVLEKAGKKLSIKNNKEADEHVKALDKAQYIVDKVAKKEVRRFPNPAFTTSTLQQAASLRLGFSAKKTMMLAQNLYEEGLITYMRTDSVNLASSAITQARIYIGKSLGQPYLPPTPRVYKAKSKNVQEAHEAIRPTNVNLDPSQFKLHRGFNRDHVRLYDLIWKRFVACQTKEALMDQTSVDVAAGSYKLRATGSVVKFDGWLKLYAVKQTEDEEEEELGIQVLPKFKQFDKLTLVKLSPIQHFTEPPPRYSEATLIKKLEELGIGRPSTYAPILSTLLERYYVERIDRRLNPTPLGTAVTEFLLRYFKDIVDYSFTAQMEDELDEIARGEREWKPIIKTFYTPFEKKIEETGEEAKKVTVEYETVDKDCPLCGKKLLVRVGRFGKFLACSGFPDCKHTESFEVEINSKCPLDSGDIVVRRTKRGKTFYGCKNWPGCKYASWNKPKESSDKDKKES